MLFNSFEFIFFFPVVVVIYFALVPRWRTAFLLIASYYFYMCWKPEYVLLILFSTIIDFFAAKKIDTATCKKNKKFWLIISLCSNLGLLFVFKYFNFFSANTHFVLSKFNIFYENPVFELLLPVGISFYTFQTLSYTIDIYFNKLKPENNFIKFALFVSFFPQLVAGPIERAANLLPQIGKKYIFCYERVVSGLRLMLWGFFKKLVIADRLALMVNQIYNFPEQQNGLTYLIGTYFFAFQIYCDFSGYSDIARGAARVMGYELMVNFNVPYISKSFSEFWQRWHISLSTWFRDYLYIPLGGNRVKIYRWYLNLLIVFIISGLWHGANWTFLTWGFLHGLYLIAGILLKKINFFEFKGFLKQIETGVQVLIVFHLTLLSWIFFRADSISTAFNIINHIIHETSDNICAWVSGIPVFNGLGVFTAKDIITGILLMAILYILDIIRIGKHFQTAFARFSGLRMLIYFVLLYSIIFFGYYGETAFIYFQF